MGLLIGREAIDENYPSKYDIFIGYNTYKLSYSFRRFISIVSFNNSSRANTILNSTLGKQNVSLVHIKE